ncbi:N-acetylneuraminate synthase [Candidatus Woesearchaeota archaeon]|jgi:sialic acid synthase SpsE|nr:N-acetylneuraminate synthase [Candidatus Woesearchaeota archaeon]
MDKIIKDIKIGGKSIGIRNPCYIIAEIGSNHNNDWDLALAHINSAISSGVDAVKFQTFNAKKHFSSFATTEYNGLKNVKVQDILKELEINREWQKPLYEYCKDRGVSFLSSPCDFEAVDQLEEIGVEVHKIASFDITDLDLVKYIATTGKPIIMSTGLANWIEIQRAVNECRSVNNNNIILLQCTSLYPAPVYLSNLDAIKSIRNRFNVLTGYSDHTEGDLIPCTSVAMGACVLEKHFTLDRSLPGPDHHFAMEPDELADMVKKIRLIEKSFGDGQKTGPRGEETKASIKSRRSVHAARDIPIGCEISSDMLINKRPGYGIEPYLKADIIGKKSKKNICADEWITWDMIL